MRNLFRVAVAVSAFAAVTLSPCVFPAVAAEKVKAWEGSISLPTYPWQDDVNPAFWAIEGGAGLPAAKGSIVYPYTMQDHLSRAKVDRTYKAVFLENEYLKVTCLPELGGRLHSVFDKTTNQEMFHANRVIKPGMIAMRGAWISGGVEWNTGPHGHTVTPVSPVDVFHGENADGSAFLEINNLEKIFRTRWTVRLTLHPGRAYLDEQIRLANPTDGVHPYYFWNCTAFPNRPGTRFIYPMTLGTDHNGTAFFNWPIDKGKDLTWLKNYDSPTSVFAHKCEFDFFGAYDVQADRGIVSTADHRSVPGKKAWTWGEGEFGKVAQNNLTDEDGAYIEVQSGPLPTQSDYGLLGPHDVVQWQEYWYPVHGLGDGFEYATKDLAFQTARKDGKLQLRVIATREIPRATLVVSRQASADGAELLRAQADLSPRRVQATTVPDVGSSPVTIRVTGPDGAKIAQFQSPLPIPKVSPPDPATFREKPEGEMTVEELYFKGRKFDRDTNRLRAREYYGKALAKDAGHVASLRALAVLDVEAGLYQDAAARCRKALARDPDDALVWYYLGVSHFRLAQFKEAGECGRRSAECFGTASLGYDLGGRAAMRLHDYAKAVELFEAAVRVSPDDERAQDHLLMALLTTNQPDRARREARRRLAQRSSDVIPRLVLGTSSDFESSLGEREFELLDASLVLDEVGMTGLAKIAVRELAGRETSKPKCGPLPLYYLAYFTAKQEGDSSDAARKDAAGFLTAAAEMSQDFIFPSRPEEMEVFKFAVEKNPRDTFAQVHLGNLLANLGRLDEASACWEKAAAANPAPAMAWRNLGLAAWAKGDLAKAETLYRKAAEARPNDQTLFRDLADVLLAASKRSEAIKVMASMPVQGVMRAEIVIALTQAYVDEKRYDDAVKLLESIPYLVNWEGQDLSWRLFNTAHIERGKQRLEKRELAAALADFEAALTYPANLNVGRSAQPQEAPAQYWRGKALAALGRQQDARAAWQAGAEGREGSAAQNEYRKRCREALDEKQ
ncbi:MAG: DUF5107 domain-containing protein [Pirellulales bacterium]